MVDYPGAIWLPNNNYFANRDGNTFRWIILHGTAGGTSAQAIGQYFQTVQVGSHYIVGVDGTVVQTVSESNGAWANGAISGVPATLPFRDAGDGVHRDPWWGQGGVNPNNQTISIEHCKASSDNSDTLSDAQKASSFSLIKDICERRNFQIGFADANGGITGHFSMDPVNRSHCPGPYPWNELFDYLKGALMRKYDTNSADFSRYFTDNGNGTWTSKKSNATLRGGNLALYQTLSIDGNTLPVIGLPRTSELAQHDADGYSWTVQFFERAVVVYDPQHKKDSAPGMGSSYLGKFEQFITLDPGYQPPK